MILSYPTLPWLYCRISAITLTSNVRTGVWMRSRLGWELCREVCVIQSRDYAGKRIMIDESRPIHQRSEIMSNEIFEFLEFLLLVLSILSIPYFLFLRPAYQRKVQNKSWGEILGHHED